MKEGENGRRDKERQITCTRDKELILKRASESERVLDIFVKMV